MERQRQRPEGAPARQRHRQEQLVGQVLAHRDTGVEVTERPGRGRLRHCLGPDARLAEGRDDLGRAFALELDHDCVARAGRVAHLLD
jgi:hypothetical protein